jgi:hypothetical protein
VWAFLTIVFIYIWCSHWGPKGGDLFHLFSALRITSGVVLLVIVGMHMLMSDYKKEIKLPKLFKTNSFGPGHPNWNDFQEFLKERNNESKTKI